MKVKFIFLLWATFAFSYMAKAQEDCDNTTVKLQKELLFIHV